MAAKKNGITDTEDSLVEVLQREKIRHLLASELFIVKPGTEVKEVVDLMRTQGVGCILVGIKKKLQGIFTERDYLERLRDIRKS
jgi:predicted transcriptional regulator